MNNNTEMMQKIFNNNIEKNQNFYNNMQNIIIYILTTSIRLGKICNHKQN